MELIETKMQMFTSKKYDWNMFYYELLSYSRLILMVFNIIY